MTTFLRQALIWIGLATVLQVGAVMIDRAIFPLIHASGDDTDSASERSGLGLRTDHGTGCQYLESRFGGLVPRLDAAGRHVCKRGM